jgi:hypothetical protein
MRKSQLLGLMLIVACALSALFVASAFAAFEAAKWLHNGVEVNALLATESTGVLEFENTESKGKISCEGRFVGFVGEGASEDAITEVLNAAGTTKITELDTAGNGNGGLPCTSVAGCESEAEIWPFKLPFKTELDLEVGGTKFFDLVLNAEYKIFCLAGFHLVTVEELCVAAAETAGEIKNLATDVEAVGSAMPKGTCNGKANVGLITAAVGNLTFLVSGESLQASE